ncbi:MAG: hypothetical protein GY928_14335 [Colwellia sp.]|nr:hypothetical protein [Colwellia sp.]
MKILILMITITKDILATTFTHNNKIIQDWDIHQYYGQLVNYNIIHSKTENGIFNSQYLLAINGFCVSDINNECVAIDNDLDPGNYFMINHNKIIYCQVIYGKTADMAITRYIPLYLIQYSNVFEERLSVYLTTIITKSHTESELKKRDLLMNLLVTQYKLYYILCQCMLFIFAFSYRK